MLHSLVHISRGGKDLLQNSLGWAQEDHGPHAAELATNVEDAGVECLLVRGCRVESVMIVVKDLEVPLEHCLLLWRQSL